MDRRSQPIIRYYIERSNEKIEYVFDFLFTVFGARGDRSSKDKADIYYGNENVSAKLIIRKKNNDHHIWKELIEGKVNIEKELNFDLIAALAFFLTDECNEKQLIKRNTDQHGRLKYVHSYQSINQIGEIPIVNLYVNHLIKCIQKQLSIFPIPLYPAGKKGCIILSHDVDNPGKYDEIFNWSLLPKKVTFKSLLAHYRLYFGTLKNYLFDKDRNENWNFEKIIQSEEKYGFRSTYFFATVFRQSKNGHQLDVPYNLKSRKYKRIQKKIKHSPHEIGLHASYKAHKSLKSFSEEKKLLTKISGEEIQGVRHHFWHLGPNINDTLLLHENLGFKYDSSLAFNDHLGFRYNSSYPFYPFHRAQQKKINVLQLPVFCMDGNLFYKENMTEQKAYSEIERYIDSIIHHHGTGVIDWHVNTSYPGGDTFKSWGNTYLRILKYLDKRDDIWVTNCSEFEEWWTKNRFHEK